MIKARIAAAGIFVGITASLFTGSAAQALPKGDGLGCNFAPQFCEEPEGPTTPPTPPKPPKNICQVIDCNNLPEAVLEEDPEPAQPEPTEPEPTQPTDSEPTTTTQPTGGQNGDNSTGNGSSGKVTQVVRTVRVAAPAQNQEQQPVEQLDASPVASEVAAPQTETDEQSGLSSFEMLLIASTLGGAGFGLAMWLKGRKQTV